MTCGRCGCVAVAARVEPRKPKMPDRSWIAPILVLTIAVGCAKKAPAVAQVLPPPGTPSFDLDSVDIRDSAGSIPLDHPPMMRTAFAVLAMMRLSAPGVEPLLAARDIHRTVGEPLHVPAVVVSPASVRVVTWNIERGVQYESILAVLRSVEADVVLLQEVDRYCRRSGYRDVARDLGHDLGMNWVFAGEFQELGEGRRHQPAITGQAILSRHPIYGAHASIFRAQDRWRWSINPAQPRRGGRIVLTAQTADLRVYNTHAESGNNDALRMRQLLEILEAERGHADVLKVIGGDLNTTFTSGDLMHEFESAGFVDAAQSALPLRRPTSRGRTEPIDWVLGKGFSAGEARILETPWTVSDHRPVVASLHRIPSHHNVSMPPLNASVF
jgi:endonuclease/exonuclease/phosphatase family metal-dependent hydrolase